MKITIEFDTDNAAFEDGFFDQEVHWVLGAATTKVCLRGNEPGDPVPLRDSNGSTIGEVRFS